MNGFKVARYSALAIAIFSVFTACGGHTASVVPADGSKNADSQRTKHIIVIACDEDPAVCDNPSPSPSPSASPSTPPCSAPASTTRAPSAVRRSRSDCVVNPPAATPTPSPSPAIEIDDAVTGAKLSSSASPIPIVVGRHARLRLKVVQPPNGTATDVQWAVPGQTVKSYGAPASSQIQQLSSADLTAQQIAYYWIAGAAQPAAVTVQAKVNGTAVKSEADFRVDAPTSAIASVTDHVRVGPTASFPQAQALSFGTGIIGSPGIRFAFRAHAPDNGSGEIAGVQLIDLSECVQEARDAPEVCDGTRGYELDNAFLYDKPSAIAANRDASWASDDSPQSRLTGRPATSIRRDDRFHTYLMYRPSGSDSIWVTLGRLDWAWGGTARRIGDPPPPGDQENPGQAERGRWNGPFQPHWTPNPAGTATSELPQWANVFGNH